MNYSKKDILTSISLMIFFICLAITFTVFFKGLYYSDAYHLALDKVVDMPLSKVKENYDVLIAYQSIFYQGSLKFPDFVMSIGGRIHFEEVKLVFEVIQVTLAISFITSLVLLIRQYKEKRFIFLKLTAIITVVVPMIIGALAAINFESAFEIFHKIVFRNDYWIFDRFKDPIINILPETYFMHAFMLIVFIVVMLALLTYCIYVYLSKKTLKNHV